MKMITSSLTTADTENETEALGAGRRCRLVWLHFFSGSQESLGLGEVAVSKSRREGNVESGIWDPEEAHQQWDGSGVGAAVLGLFVRERTQ